MSYLPDTVRATIERYGMLRPGDRIGVAVSGGADSVCLLHVLRELGYELHVLHLNHGWRGEASDADAAFVSKLAEDLGLPCHVGRLATPVEGNREQIGREARLQFFRQAMQDFGLGKVATGHTRSDQAETVLYRLMRGSGTAGLSGIRPVTEDGRIRPLIHCSRAEVEAWLQDRGITWREDATNRDQNFDRNRIRHTLLPLIERDFQPTVADILAATAELAQDEEHWWATEARRAARGLVEKQTQDGIVVRADHLSELHPALARRVIRQLLLEVRGDLRSVDLIHVERIRQLAAQNEGHGRLQIPGADIFRSFEWLRIGQIRTETRFQLDYSFSLDPASLTERREFRPAHSGIAISLQIRRLHPLIPPIPQDSPYNEEAVDLDSDTLSGALELRNWHPGDTIELPGREPVRLKLLFQEFRIPLWERHLWPVLTSSGTIVWSRRFGPAAKHRRSGGTRTVLHVEVRESGFA